MAATLKTDAIQWHEGMLLLPQHFQQNDARNNELLSFHISQVTAFYWGVCHEKVDHSLLVNGNLHYSELEAIMPDGTVISSFDSEGETLEVDLNEYKEAIDQGPVMVYLAVPRYRYGAANASGENPRYLPHRGHHVVDENSGTGAIELERIIPNARLFVGEEPPSTFTSFPICQVSIKSNSFVLTDYIPPILKVKTESGLADKCNDISRQLREKISYISQKIVTHSLTSGSGELENIAKALTIGLLPFEAMLKSEATHPFNIYISLCTLAGQVAALDPGHIPPVFERYNHNMLKETFDKVFAYIARMIVRVQEGFTIIPFILEDRTFSLLIREEWLGSRLVIGLMAQPGMSHSDLIKWADECVISGEDYFQTAIDNRILGAKRTVIEKDEALNLTPPTGAILISVDVDEQIIQKNKKLLLFNVSDSERARPKEVVLYLPKNK